MLNYWDKRVSIKMTFNILETISDMIKTHQNYFKFHFTDNTDFLFLKAKVSATLTF